MTDYFVHKSSYVDDGAVIGAGTKIWHFCHILSGAVIGERCLVGAGALITERKVFEAGQMIVGSPAKAVRELTAEQLAGIAGSAPGYVVNAARYAAGLRRID